MKKLSQSNIYSASAEEIRELFGDYLEGPDPCVALALGSHPLGGAERNALEKSLESFGYGPRACTYAALSAGGAGSDDGIPLDSQALFLLIEGLDPLLIICADSAAATAVGRACRMECQQDAPARVFGRPAVMFGDLSGLLQSDEGKQRAWRLLKSLPKR